MRVLVCGHTSFAAQGLADRLRARQHVVTCFSRGPVAVAGYDVSGPVDRLLDNPGLAGPFDAVVNYVLLKDEPPGPNVDYVRGLLAFCAARGVRHLVHLSSISSYAANVRSVTEDAPIEPDPARKGPYGSNKVATDRFLIDTCPPDLHLSLVRPGLILGPGLLSPIVGTAVRLPWNRLLIIGDAGSVIPLVERDHVSDAIVRALEAPPAQGRDVLLLAAPDSPTRLEYARACCRELGAGLGVTTVPRWVWWCVAVGGEGVARAIGQRKLGVYDKLSSRLTRQRFDMSRTAERLGMQVAFDWRRSLRDSFDGQAPYFPAPPPNPVPATRLDVSRVTFLGFGRIVRQRHLPGLKRIGFAGAIDAYDLRAGTVDGVDVRAIDGATIGPSDLYVVASPGPAHAGAIGPLTGTRGPVLVEKPLCYDRAELDRWLDFARGRDGRTAVCHNYRFKRNVRAMTALLSAVNPGRLHHATVHFESPPVGNDSAAWLRDERRARTLLMDYSIHFLDVACRFGTGEWEVADLRHELNRQGQTSLIQGTLRANYTVAFLLRQGFGPRRARVLFNFQNFSISLGFFPDTFVPYLSNDNAWLHGREARASRRATGVKVWEKLTGRPADDSHAVALGAVGAGGASADELGVERLAPFYRALFAVADRVYGS